MDRLLGGALLRLRISFDQRGVTDIVAVSRALPVSATFTSGAAAEKSRGV